MSLSTKSHAVRARRLRQKRKLAGLCYACGKVKAATLCRACGEKQNAIQRATRLKRRLKQLCTCCGVPVGPLKTTCPSCTQFNTLRARKLRGGLKPARKGQTKAERLEAQRIHRRKTHQAGFCIRCKQPSAKWNCKACQAHKYAQTLKRRASRAAQGLCARCCQPNHSNFLECEACRTRGHSYVDPEKRRHYGRQKSRKMNSNYVRGLLVRSLRKAGCDIGHLEIPGTLIELATLNLILKRKLYEKHERHAVNAL